MENIKENHLLYRHVARLIETPILSRVWKLGDKLPSLRSISLQYNISISTALKAYYELESRSLIEARPQSGYYVTYMPFKQVPLPETSQPKGPAAEQSLDTIIEKVYAGVADKKLTFLSLGVPVSELLPIPKLNKGLIEAMRSMPSSGTAYDVVQGNQKLRMQVARRTFLWDGRLSENDLITTAGCINALSYCLMATTKRGDTIAVESPVYFGILQLASQLGLKVLELPTHPSTGIEIDALKKALIKNKISLCLLISNFSNPMGGCMPNENKKEVVKLLAKHDIPLIEDDLYGDVYFGDKRPLNCKTFDENGLVLWCSSVSKTLAPGYRVGWVSPGRYLKQVTKLKLSHSMASTGITEGTIANFLENGRYEHHLAKLRRTLQNNCQQFIKSIGEYFPENTKVSRPEGGFVLWLELDKRINTRELYDMAFKQRISIAPGRLFTLQDQFNNCMRLSYGLPWTEKLEHSLKVLGKLAKNMC